jgi:hypothetical protein
VLGIYCPRSSRDMVASPVRVSTHPGVETKPPKPHALRKRRGIVVIDEMQGKGPAGHADDLDINPSVGDMPC